MQNHRGLPKKLPARKNKAKIYSPSISPSRTNQSPRRSDQRNRTSPFITPQRGSSSSHSKHRIKSKQKPSLRPSLGQSPRHVPTIKKFDQNIIEDKINKQKPRQNQFIQTVLGMMGNLAKNNQNKSEKHGLDHKNIIQKAPNHKDVPIENKNNQISINKTYNKTTNSWVIGSTLGQSYQTVAAVSDEQLLQRCQKMLQNQNNCTKFFGDKVNGMRTGYGIQYFRNKDKFMGGFKQDKAEGHGTFYLQDLGKRIMAIWLDNKIVLDNSYIIENI